MPKLSHIKKVLVIGSGPIVIGQAAEFDYAGTQACLALKEEGVEVVLVNNNPATIMTDTEIADRIYMEPLTLESVTRIIEKERPDGILPTLGGQTGLNLAVALSDAGVLEQYDVELLGTPLDTIQRGEDREAFKAMMKEIGEPVPESRTVTTVDDALQFADTIGYPVIVRPAYTLGGAGGGIAADEEELRRVARRGLEASPIRQILIEKSVKGWKEIEYEVMRDANDTCIIVCNMENMDPVGIHTGDSIVVAPSQTLNDRQYQMLRSVACKVIRALGVVGGCNIQYALDPESDQYYLIEVNPRVSRSSALASKATGYPIARIAAKLALGYHLDEVINPITGYTYASFEPSIDYVVAKIPRWPFDKFPLADRKLGTQMKATGEVMALGRNLETALLKAVRSLEIGLHHLSHPAIARLSNEQLEKGMVEATDERIFLIAEAFRRGYGVADIHRLTEIDPFFLQAIELIIQLEKKLKASDWDQVDDELLVEAKKRGFADETLADIFGISLKDVRERWKERGLAPAYKQVDTCAAEFVAQTPYYYSSWHGLDEVEVQDGRKKVLVIGSGPIRIGQGVEFDYCSVHAAKSLRRQGIEAVVINNNPETVSTDFNTADQLYFEPLTVEDVLQVVEKEKVDGALVQFGGQTAVNLAGPLAEHGVHIYGTDIQAIDDVEDRDLFYQMLKELEIPHIPGRGVRHQEEAFQAAADIGYPVLIRPSYVIGGRGMVVVYDEAQLADYFTEWSKTSTDRLFPLLIDKYVPGIEVEVDAVCDGEDVLIPGIFQHVERAGVHSGDSLAVFPAPGLTDTQKQTVARYTGAIARKMKAVGLMNIQMVIDRRDQTIYVLEVNPRASRTVPIVSKVTGVPMVHLATRCQMGDRLQDIAGETGLMQEIPFYAVKAPVFSTVKLNGVDPALGPEMKSTGESLGLGLTAEEAMAKALYWKEDACVPLIQGDVVLLSLSDPDKKELERILPGIQRFDLQVAATPGTAEVLAEHGVSVKWILDDREKAQEWLLENKVKAMCITPTRGNDMKRPGFALRQLALQFDVPCFTSLDTFMAYTRLSGDKVTEPRELQKYLSMNREKEGVSK
ncbi:MAG: carbamoyl-phosphate synthase (glutamine-hydrolyzing) large subunit [Bacillaceae bacterium]|nr:carbamoyl-phosphate synthase (glutamine-hydrolyzing) large subunit [Bacillaceae bacterium]